MLRITTGSSVITPRPIASPLSAMPGPDDAVTAIEPPYAAPRAAPIAAISSSAWNVIVPKFLYFASECRIDDAGVIG